MNRFIILFSCLFLCSCSTWNKVPSKLDSFVEKTEASAQYYTDEDWELSNAQFETLIDTYWDNIDKYTKEERASVTNSIARYQTLIVLNDVSETIEIINLVKEIAPSYLNGIRDAVNESRSGIIDLLDEFVDFSEIEQSVSSLKDEVSGFVDDLVNSIDSSDDR